MRLFYQSFGVSRGTRDGRYGRVLKSILDRAAAPGTEISIHGLSPHRAIAEQYRYLEFLDTDKRLRFHAARIPDDRNDRRTEKTLVILREDLHRKLTLLVLVARRMS